MRNWKDFWNKIAANNDDLYKQVARTSKDNKPVNEEVLDLIAEHIKNKLDLKTTDILIDVCCGNGLITQRISSDCEKIIGIDISDILINNATKHCAGSNIYYIEAEALGLSKYVDLKADKILLYFSFQYFDSFRKGMAVIAEMLKVLKPGGKIFIGDIPNLEHLWEFYKTFKSRFYYLTGRLKGTNTMGKFWSCRELDEICKKYNVKGTYYEQPVHLPYDHYRFDYLIVKE